MRTMLVLALLALLVFVGCSGAAATPATTSAAHEDPANAPPPVTGALCGTRGAAQCGAGTFCDFAIDANCGADDRGGHCAEMPQACTREYMPVCGCDGATHPTACTAHSSGVAVAHDGPC